MSIIAKKLVYLSISFFIIIILNYINVHSFEEKPMLIGKFNWNEWLAKTEWDNTEFLKYNPSHNKIETLKTLISEKQCSFLIFGGSWCGDTKSELPKIFKIFTLCELELDKIPIIGVDRQKLEPSGFSLNYKIERVPTLIVLSDNQEIGRITEFPNTTWEDDLIEILEQK
ncbi:MAG: thioredoxin family protein [Candidatus Kapabacteria bacterium]|nr:thioredoxin family protein [Candidatus Kapabacteria bacterium]